MDPFLEQYSLNELLLRSDLQIDQDERRSRRRRRTKKERRVQWSRGGDEDIDDTSDQETTINSPQSEQEQQHSLAQDILIATGSILQQADQTLSELEREGRIGHALLRVIHAVADVAGNIARDLETEQRQEPNQQQEEKEIQQQTYLEQEQEFTPSPVTREEFIQSIPPVVIDLLRDAEETLRAVDSNEAEEIAELSLMTAQFMVASLQSIHATLTPQDLLLFYGDHQSGYPSSSMQIELIPSDEEELPSRPKSRHEPTQPDRYPRSKRDPLMRMGRVRVLWPPLGPVVNQVVEGGKQFVCEKPLLAVGVGLVAWPGVVITAICTAPLIVVDGVLQNVYEQFQDTPVISGMEQSAAQAFQTGKLIFICGRLVGRQGIRIVSKQIQRQGGIGPLAQAATSMAVDRLTHPVETAGMIWNALQWGCDALHQTWGSFHDDERVVAVQELQQ